MTFLNTFFACVIRCLNINHGDASMEVSPGQHQLMLCPHPVCPHIGYGLQLQVLKTWSLPVMTSWKLQHLRSARASRKSLAFIYRILLDRQLLPKHLSRQDFKKKVEQTENKFQALQKAHNTSCERGATRPRNCQLF